jgi:catechol 2,3-dioxygenase-like lactoylglutathione lyase family enzyme
MEAQTLHRGRLIDHVQLVVKDIAASRCFHEAVMAELGVPGERPYHPGYYAAFARDPDGHTIEAVCHGAAKRSAKSVEIAFEA